MNTIQNFAFEDHLVRTVEKSGEPWFVGKDVCDCLDLKNHRTSLDLLDDDERGVHSMDTLGGSQEMVIVSEAGVYRLVFRSRKEEAERFKRWLAHEVLPQIRKTGAYGQPKPETIERITLETEAPLMARVEAVKVAARLWGRDRARSLWGKLGLPSVPPAPVHEGAGEARACLRVLLEHTPVDSRTIRELIMDAFDGDEEARLLCHSCGVRPSDDGSGFSVANLHPALSAIYAGSEWAGRTWRLVLRRLAGAAPTGTIRFQPNVPQARATWLPTAALDEGAIS